MRITFNTLNRHMQHVIQDRYADMAKLQEQLATGKRLLRPSDAPIDVANDMRLRTKMEQMTQFKKNIDDGKAWMGVTDTAMMSMNSLMQRSRELAIQAANDTLTSDERVFIQKETEQLTRQLISLLNTNYKGDYVFAGTQTKLAPFPIESSQADSADDYANLRMSFYDGSAGVGVAAPILDAFDPTNTNRQRTNIVPGTMKIVAGGVEYVEGRDYTVDYVNGTITPLVPALAVDVSEGGAFGAGPNGYYDYTDPDRFEITFDYVAKPEDIYGDPVVNTGEVLREIEEGIVMPINIAGDELLTDPATGYNALETLVQFNQDLLQGGSRQIERSIEKIDVVSRRMLAAQTKNGARVNRFETTLERNEMQFTETTRLQSELEDAELAETISDFSLLETVYNAALKSAARSLQPSLADFL